MNCIRILVIALLANITCAAQSDLTDRLKPPVAGLVKADLASVKMNADTIARLIKSINTTPPKDFRGIVVIKNNNLVVEEYFNTYWRETIHDIRSAGKSVTALLLGIAIDKGLVKSTEQSIYDFFPRAKFDQPKKDGHQEIKIKHLLAMSSGLSADDDDNNSPGGTGNWITANHWVNFATSLPMIFKSGEKFVYNDICPMLVGAHYRRDFRQKACGLCKRKSLYTAWHPRVLLVHRAKRQHRTYGKFIPNHIRLCKTWATGNQ
jgi:CubicO group peptidase (beta-lactamase class C family)